MTSPSKKRLVTAVVVAAFLAGCSGNSQSALSPSQSIPLSSQQASRSFHGIPSLFSRPGGFIVPKPSHQKSWISPAAATGKALMYVSNVGNATVAIYSYTGGNNPTLVGTLTGFTYPTAPCSDTKGNIFIPDYATSEIVEYRYGKTTPVQTIQDPGGQPSNCSVDPLTGNLAVANFGASNVGVYSGTTGLPTTYPVPNQNNPEFVGWDNKSNLYINGLGVSTWELAELPTNAPGVAPLTVAGATPYYAGGVQFGGSYLLVADQGHYGYTTSFVYQISVSGSVATIVNTIPLAGTIDVAAPQKRGATPTATIAAADAGASAGYVYGFPSGTQTSTFSGTNAPFGVTIAQKK